MGRVEGEDWDAPQEVVEEVEVEKKEGDALQAKGRLGEPVL